MPRIGSRYFPIRPKQKHDTPSDCKSGTRLTVSPPVCRESTNLLLLAELPPHLLAGHWARHSRAGTALVSRGISGQKRKQIADYIEDQELRELMLKLRRVGSIDGSTSQIHSEVSGKRPRSCSGSLMDKTSCHPGREARVPPVASTNTP
jgi:hypothetical protein